MVGRTGTQTHSALLPTGIRLDRFEGTFASIVSCALTQSGHHDCPVFSSTEAKKMRKKGDEGEVEGGMTCMVEEGDEGLCVPCSAYE